MIALNPPLVDASTGLLGTATDPLVTRPIRRIWVLLPIATNSSCVIVNAMLNKCKMQAQCILNAKAQERNNKVNHTQVGAELRRLLELQDLQPLSMEQLQSLHLKKILDSAIPTEDAVEEPQLA